MKWLKNWLGQRNFNSAWSRVAAEKFKEAVIDAEEYADCMLAARNPEALRRARNQLRAGDGTLGGISDWDWSAIYHWFVNSFIPAMRIIVPIALLLLQEPATPDDKE